MSTAYVLGVFTVVIIVMILLISKFKVHAAMSILLAAIALGILLGTPWAEIEGIINSGFAGTIKSVGIVIFLGCVMGIVLEKTGAAIKITKAAISLFGEKNIIWAIAASSFILGISIWADTVVILLIPIISMIAAKTGKSMMSLGTALYMGALVTASLVPPTPGPVAAAALLNVPLGEAILWGLIVSVPSVIAATLYSMTLKEKVLPKEEYLEAARVGEEAELPSLLNSLLPILFPLALIITNTALQASIPDASISEIFAFIGSPLAALLTGCMLSLILTKTEWKSKKVLNDWVEEGIKAAAMPIIVTGLGGALATFVKNAGVAEKIAEMVATANFPGILIPIIIAAIIHVVTGSNALAVMTAAALVQPMLVAIGVSPVAALLACGTGALMFKHANSSGFWVTVTMSNMDIKQGIRGIGVGSTVAGATGALITIALHFAGII